MKKLDTYWRIGEGVLVTTAATLDRKYGARLRAVVPRLLALDCITRLSLSAEHPTHVETLVPRRSDSLEADTLAALDAVHAAWNGAPEWIPWPTSPGFWWARARPGAALCVVEARVEAESSWIYFTGVECPLYANEPREAWEFCRAEPSR
ncbi:MAG: hypothetical protein Q8S73_36845 [Deltaproteobacteria bacterium]|nr:hypothetical protein [Myxococcales bacterium]MDP3219728.1 hypothetical protein [Deltaproteobacteria bacterium]